MVYVQRWHPVMKPVTRVDDDGRKHVERPNCLKIHLEDGPITEQLIYQQLGAGDYSFRLNDSRIRLNADPNAATVVYSELKGNRNWNDQPPTLDYKQLDLTDPANASFITWARSRNLLPPEGEQHKQDSDMAQSAVVDNLLDMGKEDRARLDRLQQQQLEKAEREAREAKARIEELEAKLNTPTPVEGKKEDNGIVGTVSALVDIVKAIKPEPDNSLSAYLALQMEREKTQREQDRADRQAAADNAKIERDRADKLQNEILADLRNRANVAPVAPPAQKTLLEQFQEVEAFQGVAKRIARGGPGEEEPVKVGMAEKIIEAIPAVAPIIGNLFTLGFQTFQQWSHNQAVIAIAKGGKTPEPTPAATPAANGQPAAVPADQPMPPTLTPEQVAQQQQFTFYMQMLSMAAPKMLSFLKKDIEDPGFQFAAWVIENAPHERADYDAIRELGMEQVTGEHGTLVKQFNLARAKMNILNLVQHHPQLSSAVGPIQSRFDTFLDQFFNYDEIMAEQEQDNPGPEGAPLQ